MKSSLLLTAGVMLLSASMAVVAQNAPQADADSHTKESIAGTGDGQAVSMRGRPLSLTGKAIKLGEPIATALVTGGNMAGVDITTTKGKVRILNIVPSLDTKTCEAQTHELSETNDGLDQQVELVTISMDLPFAQRRFAETAKIKNVTFYSDYRGAAFGLSSGLLVKPSHLLARSLIVLDKNNVVRHIQVVPDQSKLPDMKEAFKVARTLL